MRIYYINELVARAVAEHLKESIRGLELVVLDYSEHNPPDRFEIDEEPAVLLWGNGSMHQVSYAFRPNKPYSKVVYDAHDDFATYDDELNCCNHNTALVFNDDNLRKIEVLGSNVPMDYGPSVLKADDRIRRVSTLDSRMVGEDLHVSFDLDVIHDFPSNPLYSKGEYTLDQVAQSFSEILKTNRVIRVDIGGLFTTRPRSFAKGAEAYSRILEMCRELCKNRFF